MTLSHPNNTRQHRFTALMTSAALAAVLASSPALANPTGAKVTAGSASIAGEGTGRVTIQQSSDKAVIDWHSFGIAAGESTTFVQPGATSIALNRVTGGDVSTILGDLHANGRVFLINPNGILFGKSARVDVGGLLATTADISNEAFMAGGAMRFGTPGKADAQIIVEGHISVRDAGVAAFVAPQVVNDGVITAHLGKIALGGAESFTLDLNGDNLIRFQLGDAVTSQDIDGALVEVGGVVDARGGSLQITASAARELVNQSVRIGDVQTAGEAQVNADGSVSLIANRVALAASGEIQTGKNVSIDLSSATNGGDTGGRLNIAADRTILDGTVNLDGSMTGGSADISGNDFLSFGSILSASGTELGGNVNLTAGGLSLAGQIAANAGVGKGGAVTIHASGRAIDTGDAFVDATGLHGGSISYTSDSQIISSGTLRASGTYGFGGTIDMTAPRLDLFSGQYYAQGGVKGGRIRIGGEYQGGKGLTTDELANASNLVATDGVVIDASAIGQRGMGGEIVLWSDEKTTFLGTVRAKGGLFGGPGGLIEISGAEDLLYNGTVETARGGMRGGTLLLDPKNITVADVPPSQYGLVLNALSVSRNASLEERDFFGNSISLDGNRLAVGANNDDGATDTTFSAGAVYLFSFADAAFSTPLLEGILGAGYSGGKNLSVTGLSDADGFGASVSLDGNRLAVGSPGDDGLNNGTNGAGAVYLFSFADAEFSTPRQEAVIGRSYTGGKNLSLLGLERSDAFGRSVSLNGNRLAVGATGDDGATVGGIDLSGAVYLFSFADDSFSTPALEGRLGTGYNGAKDLSVPGLERRDQFGQSVSLDGNRLAVGASSDAGATNAKANSGAVYLFNFADAAFSTPTLISRLGDGYSGGKNLSIPELDGGFTIADNFGSSVSLDGNRLAVGAPGDAGAANASRSAGAAYLFSFDDEAFSNPVHEATLGRGYAGGKNLSVSGVVGGDSFGIGVSLDGNRLAVGAFGDDGATNTESNSGAVYLFNFTDAEFSSPAQLDVLGAGYGNVNLSRPLLESDDKFGTSVSLDGNRLAVGAQGDGGANNNASVKGAVYLFSFADAEFSTPALEGILGDGYTGGKNLSVTRLDNNDRFGTSVSLDGNRLAVGAPGDGSANNGSPFTGAVYLFNFADAAFSSPTLQGILGSGYSGGNNLNVPNLAVGGMFSNDIFGSSVSLDGNRLAVGATHDAGTGDSTVEAGAVYLFSFADAAFSSPTLQGILGKGYGGTKDLDVSRLDQFDRFGSSVSLDGNRLAVGAYFDKGADNSSLKGAVYLFNFADAAFSSPALQGLLGKGYSGGNNFDVSSLERNDDFGISVSLDGNRLAVGAVGDNGNGNASSDSGAVYLFSFADTGFSGAVQESISGFGYSGGKNLPVTGLEADDAFGISVSLDGTRLVVGANGDDGPSDAISNAGAVYLFDLNDGLLGSNLYADNPGSDVTITPESLTAILDGGTSVVLQANNDIFVNNAVSVNNPAGDGGGLALQAGRSIFVNAGITSDNGNVTLFANDRLASGVVDIHRDPGAAEISFGTGGFIDAGTGSVLVQIRDGAGKTNFSSGQISLGAITGSAITVLNEGLTPGSGITLNAGALLTASGAGNAIVLSGDNFINNAGAGVFNLTGGGRFVVFSDDWDADMRGGLTGSNIYNRTINSPGMIGQPGNLFVYARQPILTFTANDASREYGLTNPVFSSSFTGLVNGDSAGYAFNGAAGLTTTAGLGTSVGTVPIIAGLGTLLSDVGYGFAFAPGTLSITKALLNVAADDKSREYGLVNPALTSNITGFRNGDDLSVISGLSLATTATQGADVGNYAITASGASANNYDFAFAPGTLSITKALLNISADDKTREYGLVNPLLTSSITGFRNGDNESVITGLTLATTAAQGSDVGNYAITATGGMATNYDLAFAPGTLAITKALLTVTADDKTREYGHINPLLTNTVTGFRIGDDASVISGLTLATAATQRSDVGNYAITTSGAGATNYDFTFAPGTLSITKALLSIIADDKTREYGLVNPALTSTITGFRNGDDASVISGLTLASGAMQDSDVGNYAITAFGANATNYDFTFASGMLTITKALLNVTADDKTREYGLVNPALTSTITGFRNSDDVSVISGLSLATTATQGADVGNYAIAASGASATNYDFIFAPGTLTITKALLNVTADDKAREYGLINPLLTSTITGFRNSDDLSVITGLTLATAATQGSDVGNYSITASGAMTTNYDFAFTPGILSISKALLNISADDKAREYGLVNPALTSSITGFRNGDDLSVVSGLMLATAATQGSDVGNYSITASGAMATNYGFAFTPGNLSITKAPLNIAADDKTREYGLPNAALTSAITGFRNGDDASVISGLTLATAATQGSDVGNYVITASGAMATNYDFAFVPGLLSITKALLNITADDKSREYGLVNPTLTSSITGFRNGDDISVIKGLTLMTAADLGSNVGDYAITASSANAINYRFAYAPGTLSVLPSNRDLIPVGEAATGAAADGAPVTELALDPVIRGDWLKSSDVRRCLNADGYQPYAICAGFPVSYSSPPPIQ